jgi:ATP-dependent helicase/nuclease subunit A
MASQALSLLDAPRFGVLFGKDSRAEVPIVGWITAGGQKVRVSGQVDRLAIAGTEIFIADYKTNRPPPRIAPPAYVRQLACYRAVLQKLYPQSIVRAALVWTEIPDLMELSGAELDEALVQVTSA